MRMMVCPAIVLVLFKVTLPFLNIANEESILLITFLSAISPTAATIMQFAQVYDNDVELAVSANIITTISCIFIMPLWVFMYMM